jgi:hypothetical protein
VKQDSGTAKPSGSEQMTFKGDTCTRPGSVR